MDNFRQPQKRKHASVDGFVPARHAKRHDLRAFDQYYSPNRSTQQNPAIPKIDSFKYPEGFVPNAQPMIPRPGQINPETEVTMAFESKQSVKSNLAAEDMPSPRKRRFGFRKKHDNHHAHSKPHRIKTGLRLTAVAGAFILLVGGGLALRSFLTGRNIFKGGGSSLILNNTNVDPTLLKGEGDGRVNILILGKGGEEQKDGPDLTDTIMIASIDPIAKEAALLSIPRDLWVKSPSGYQSKINQVYADAKSAVLNNYSSKQRNSQEAIDKAEKAGVEAMKKTVSEAMGVPLHYYAMIDFTGFKKAIDTVGGIEIDVKEPLIDASMAWQNGGKATIADVGLQKFNGTRALMYARSRKGSAGGDFDRAERQRQVILALKDKVLSTGTLANPIKLNQLLSDFGGNVSTDFSVNEILRIYDLAKEISGDKVASVGLNDHVVGDTINNLSVQVPKAGLFDYTDIQNYVRNIMQDAFLKNEDAKLIILNGTNTAGLATKKSKELQSFGYKVLSVGDAPTKTYTDTILVDMRNGEKKYTLNYLEKRLGVKAVTSLPDQKINATGADFVIILGTQENSQTQ
jgi:LCP family protein required for cell wall assembly